MKRARVPARNFVTDEAALLEEARIATKTLNQCIHTANNCTLEKLRRTYGFARVVGVLGTSAGEVYAWQERINAIKSRTAARAALRCINGKLDRLRVAWSRAVVKWMGEECVTPVADAVFWPDYDASQHVPTRVAEKSPYCLVQSSALESYTAIPTTLARNITPIVRYYVAYASGADQDGYIYRQFGYAKRGKHTSWCVPFAVDGLSIPRAWYLWVGRGDDPSAPRNRAREMLYGKDSDFGGLPQDIKNVITCMARDSS